MPDFPHDLPTIDVLERMSAEELDELPFGVLRLDADGDVLRANRTETSRIGRSPEDFVGRNFFEEIAPCANVREYAGEFREGAARGELARIFGFDYRLGDGRTESVVVYLGSSRPGTGWVAATVRRRIRRTRKR